MKISRMEWSRGILLSAFAEKGYSEEEKERIIFLFKGIMPDCDEGADEIELIAQIIKENSDKEEAYKEIRLLIEVYGFKYVDKLRSYFCTHSYFSDDELWEIVWEPVFAYVKRECQAEVAVKISPFLVACRRNWELIERSIVLIEQILDEDKIQAIYQEQAEKILAWLKDQFSVGADWEYWILYDIMPDYLRSNFPTVGGDIYILLNSMKSEYLLPVYREAYKFLKTSKTEQEAFNKVKKLINKKWGKCQIGIKAAVKMKHGTIARVKWESKYPTIAMMEYIIRNNKPLIIIWLLRCIKEEYRNELSRKVLPLLKEGKTNQEVIENVAEIVDSMPEENKKRWENKVKWAKRWRKEGWFI